MGSQEGSPRGGFLTRFADTYRRRPWLAWSVTVLLVVGVAGALLLAFGDDSEPASASINCSAYDSDGLTVVTVQGTVSEEDAEDGCAEIAARLSGGGSYWRVGLPPIPNSSPEMFCALNAPDGDEGTATVEVDPATITTYTAETICSSLVANGWREGTVGRLGRWQVEWEVAADAQAQEEELQREQAELEGQEEDEEAEAIEACKERAEATEEEEVEQIERAMKQRVAEAANEDQAYEIEDEAYEEEDHAFDKRWDAETRCEETGGGGIEYR